MVDCFPVPLRRAILRRLPPSLSPSDRFARTRYRDLAQQDCEVCDARWNGATNGIGYSSTTKPATGSAGWDDNRCNWGGTYHATYVGCEGWCIGSFPYRHPHSVPRDTYPDCKYPCGKCKLFHSGTLAKPASSAAMLSRNGRFTVSVACV